MAVETTGANYAQEGKFLSFVLGEREYGLEIPRVREITGLSGITRVPRAPDDVRGVINLRGRVIPIVCLRRKFNLPAAADTDRTCIIVVEVVCREAELLLGVIVDEVADVLAIKADQITPPPAPARAARETPAVAGLGRLGARDVILLDGDAILTSDEFDAVVRTTVG